MPEPTAQSATEVTTAIQDSRLDWIEPTLTQLDVRETSINPARGLDYGMYYRTGAPYVDCTRS